MQYLKVIRRGKKNVRIELPDHSTCLVPVEDLSKWEMVENPDPSIEDLGNSDSGSSLDGEKSFTKPAKPKTSKKKVSYKAGVFNRNTNGLGVDHPYETVDTSYEKKVFEEGVFSPF